MKIRSMTRCRQRDIILIRFPYSDPSNIKRKPALVISSNWYNNARNDLIVLAITSNVPNAPGRDDHILSEDESRACGLLKASVIKLGKIMTLDKGFVLGILGTLPEETFNEIMRELQDVIG